MTSQERRADRPRLKVGLAEYAVATDRAVLTTSGLGSCLGIALCDPRAGVGGLVHAMLPKAPDGGTDRPGKFVDSGLSILFEEVLRAGADRERVVAKVAGGSEMLNLSGRGPSIGSQNIEAARSCLERHGVALGGEDVGGDYGRSIRVYADTGAFVVTTASRGTTRL
jgi:chemotaxis protein CheD